MKINNNNLGIVISISLALVSSAALKPLSSSRSTSSAIDNKLHFLDKQGYEVISNAEEILTPVSSDKDGVNLSDGVISKPDMLLYGRFYVLKKKDTMMDNAKKTETYSRSYPPSIQQYFQYRTRTTTDTPPPVSSSSSTEKINFLLQTRNNSPRIHTNNDDHRTKPQQSHKQRHQSDSIFFPGDEDSSSSTTTTKKYLRLKKDRHQSHETIPMPSDRTDRTTRDNNKNSQTSQSLIAYKKPEVILESQEANQFDEMNSEEFVEWAKDNLNSQQIVHLLQDESNQQEQTSDIQYNSFIVVPGLKCPEGHRINHRGVCTSKYIHIPSPTGQHKIKQRVNKGNAKKKLKELLQTLKAIEAEIETEIKVSEIIEDKKLEDTTVSSTTFTSTDTDLILTER